MQQIESKDGVCRRERGARNTPSVEGAGELKPAAQTCGDAQLAAIKVHAGPYRGIATALAEPRAKSEAATDIKHLPETSLPRHKLGECRIPALLAPRKPAPHRR